MPSLCCQGSPPRETRGTRGSGSAFSRIHTDSCDRGQWVKHWAEKWESEELRESRTRESWQPKSDKQTNDNKENTTSWTSWLSRAWRKVSVSGECVCAGPERGNEDTWSWEDLPAKNTPLLLEKAWPSLQTPLSRKVVDVKVLENPQHRSLGSGLEGIWGSFQYFTRFHGYCAAVHDLETEQQWCKRYPTLWLFLLVLIKYPKWDTTSCLSTHFTLSYTWIWFSHLY